MVQISSRLAAPPTPRKRYGVYCGPWFSPRRPRPVGKGCHRVGMPRTTSRQSLHMHHSIRNLEKTKAARDSQFAGLTRVAFETANRTRTPLSREDRIFLKELANLGAVREITTGLVEARAAADRAAELAPFINAEREAQAQASLEREEDQRAFAMQREAQAAAERERLYKTKLQAEELMMRKQRAAESHRQRQREDALHRQQQAQFADRQRFRRFFEEAAHNEQLRQQAEAARLDREKEACRRNEEAARLREEQEAFRRKEEERTRLENERLAREHKDAQAFIEAALRFQQEAHDRLQQEQAARLQAERDARAWFEAAQQAETDASHAKARWNSRGFDGVDVSMRDASMHPDMDASMRIDMDASMRIDMDVSMRTAAPYSPPPSPPPPPLTVADRFALYERKWAALKSDVPVLSFELLPWPTLHDVSTPEDITDERMAEFFYNSERPGYEKKTQKERNRVELLRWHPDKFLGKVLGKVDVAHRVMVEEAVGQVSRFLITSAAL